MGDPIGLAHITFAARPCRQAQALGEGEHLDGEADVDRELECETLAVSADASRRPQFAQHRLDAAIGELVAADHDRERPRLNLWDAARDGRIEHLGAEVACPCRKFAADARTHRTEVDPDPP
jgi:hypothetical protein